VIERASEAASNTCELHAARGVTALVVTADEEPREFEATISNV